MYKGLKDCGKKIVSATKFIDYFVHDMLDYTVLNQDDEKFTRTITVFDARDAINEIIEILEDKIIMKNIKCDVEYINFNKSSGFFIKTDQKRLQQVLLNLLSNAIKFTERNGNVKIVA